MQSNIQDIQLLIEPTNKTWGQTIKYWTTNIENNIKFLGKGGLWLGTTIAGMTTLNIVSNKINLNEELEWNEVLNQLIAPTIIGTTAASLIISVIKNILTNFASHQWTQTGIVNFFKKNMSKLLKKPYEETTNISLSEISENNYAKLDTLLENINKYPNDLNLLLEQIVNVLTLNQITNQEIISSTCCTYDNSIVAGISNEIYKVGVMFLAFTLGMFFSSSINILKTEVADSNNLEFSAFYKTLFDLNNILISFIALFIFRIKFKLLDNAFKNLQQLSIVKLTKELIRKFYNYVTNDKHLLTAQEIAYIHKLDDVKVAELLKMVKILTNVDKKLTAVIKSKPDKTIKTDDKTKDHTTWLNNVKHLMCWVLATSTSTIVDSFYGIIMTQVINSNNDNNNDKPKSFKLTHENPLLNTVFTNLAVNHINLNFLNILKILVSKENLLLAILGQIGFIGKMKIMDWCWNKFITSSCYTLSNIPCFNTKSIFVTEIKSQSPTPYDAEIGLTSDTPNATNKTKDQFQQKINDLKFLSNCFENVISKNKTNLLNLTPTKASTSDNDRPSMQNTQFNASEINMLFKLKTQVENILKSNNALSN